MATPQKHQHLPAMTHGSDIAHARIACPRPSVAAVVARAAVARDRAPTGRLLLAPTRHVDRVVPFKSERVRGTGRGVACPFA